MMQSIHRVTKAVLVVSLFAAMCVAQDSSTVTLPVMPAAPNGVDPLCPAPDALSFRSVFARNTADLILQPLLGFQAGYWCDKLALRPYAAFWQRDDERKWADITAAILRRSFNLRGLTPEEVSDRIEDGIGDGVTLYAGYRQTIAQGSLLQHAFSAVTRFDFQMTIPSAPFLVVFSDGLRAGTTLDMSNFRQEIICATDLCYTYTDRLDLPTVNNFVNMLTGYYFDLSRSAFSGGVHGILGHRYFSLKTDRATLSISQDGASFSIDGSATTTSSGNEIHRLRDLDELYKGGVTVSGWGLGVDAGLMLYGEFSLIGLTVRNLGFMRWHSIREREYLLRGNDMDIEALLNSKGEIDFWLEENNGCKSNIRDSLRPGSAVTIAQATTVRFDAAYQWQLFDREASISRWISPFLVTHCGIVQGLSRRPAVSFIPQFVVDGQSRLLCSHLPVMAGFAVGGWQRWQSSAGTGFVSRNVDISLMYTAIGSVFWNPRRGFQLSLNCSFNFPLVAGRKEGPIINLPEVPPLAF